MPVAIFIDVGVISLLDNLLGIATVTVLIEVNDLAFVTIILVDVAVVNSLTDVALVVVTALIEVIDSVPIIIPGDVISLFATALVGATDAVDVSLLPDVAVLVSITEAGDVISLLDPALVNVTVDAENCSLLDKVLMEVTVMFDAALLNVINEDFSLFKMTLVDKTVDV